MSLPASHLPFRASPRRWPALALGAALLGSALSATAATDDDPRWYRVEVVIFENRNLGDASMEVWPANPGEPDVSMVKDLRNPPAGFSVTYTDQLELGGAAQQLTRSGRYNPLLHVAWTQQGLDQRHAIPLRIEGGVVYPPLPAASVPEPSPLLAQTPTSPTGTDPASGATTYGVTPPVDVAPPVLHQLDGTLTLVLGRYLHLYTDLIDRRLLAPNAVPFSDGVVPQYDNGQALVSFRIREHRKMRSKELHYIDHPVLGILVKVNPVEAPAPDPAATSDSPAPTPADPPAT